MQFPGHGPNDLHCKQGLQQIIDAPQADLVSLTKLSLRNTTHNQPGESREKMAKNKTNQQGQRTLDTATTDAPTNRLPADPIVQSTVLTLIDR